MYVRRFLSPRRMIMNGADWSFKTIDSHRLEISRDDDDIISPGEMTCHGE